MAPTSGMPTNGCSMPPPGGEFKAEAANRLALLAQEMGVLKTAQLVQV